MKIAICYYGILRSFNKYYQTHIDNIYNVLKEDNIEFDIFIHTWKGKYTKYIWDGENTFDDTFDIDTLIQPKKYIVDDQDETFLNNLDFSKYFYQHIFDIGGKESSDEWWPDLVRNHLCAIESQKRVVDMAGDNYDYYLLMRPDTSIDLKIDTAFIYNIYHTSTVSIIIPNYSYGDGYNAQIALCHKDNVKIYSHRINTAERYRKTKGRLAAEKFIKNYLDDENITPILYNFIYYTIHRP